MALFLLWLLPTAFDGVDLQPVADIHTLTVAELLIVSLAALHCLFYTCSKGKPLYVFTQGSTALLLFIKKLQLMTGNDYDYQSFTLKRGHFTARLYRQVKSNRPGEQHLKSRLKTSAAFDLCWNLLYVLVLLLKAAEKHLNT